MAKEIPLTQGKVALVDDADFEWLNQWKWYYHEGYAVRTINGPDRVRQVRMHRLIMNAPPDAQVDHIDGNGLNNQRSNLRLCDATGNARNCRAASGATSRFKGVSRDKAGRGWRAYIGVNYQTIYLGLFASEVVAAQVHDTAARKLHGEYARLNFPDHPALTKEEIESLRLKPAKTSKYRGVSWDRPNKKWVAFIQVKRKTMNLGRFTTEIEAARAYNAAAIKYHGSKAKLNQLKEIP